MAAPPQPAAKPPTAPLVNLPDDLVALILRRIPCRGDRGSMCLVCKTWRAAITLLKARAPLPRPLPWLLLPSRFPGGPTRAACVLSGGDVVHSWINILPPRARFVGSYDGAWIFLHYGQARAHWLLNFRTNQARRLPSLLLRWDYQYVENMFILAATLSSSPDGPNCVGAAIVAAWWDPPPPDPYAVAVAAPPPFWRTYRRCLAFWRMGSDSELAYERVLGANHRAVYHMEDVVHHDGAFKVLVNYGDHILLCTQAAPMWGWINLELLFFRPVEGIYNHRVRARYLVESRGELLKVVRFKHGRNQPTSDFKVFRATKRLQVPDANCANDIVHFPIAEYPWAWSELDTLGGRILFVGYGCSRSYEADQYPGFEPGIYFLDDGKFYDEALFFQNHPLRPYPCVDSGKWSEGRAVQRCFPRPNPSYSHHSPPAWLLP